MTESQYQKNLRSGRFSLPGQFYAITKCCHNKKTNLIPDFNNFSSGEFYFQVFADTISWLNQKDHIFYPSAIMMPDHCHLVFQLGEQKNLSQVMESFCKFTARKYNEKVNITGKFWQHGFYDHAIRSNESIMKQINYILENPVRKCLVDLIEDWQYKIINYPPIIYSR